MNIRPAVAIILCSALAFSAQAMPINYTQIGEAHAGQPARRSSTSQPAAPTTSQTTAQITGSLPEGAAPNLTVESLEQPEFVRLSDGRLIPYGPGVICSEVCVETDVAANPPGLSRKWLLVIPLAGAAIAGILLAGDNSLPRPTAVGSVSQSPTPTPSVPPNGDQPQPVPEPGTVALLSAGLAWLARKRVRAVFQRSPK